MGSADGRWGTGRVGMDVVRGLALCFFVRLLCVRRGGGAVHGAPLTQARRDWPMGTSAMSGAVRRDGALIERRGFIGSVA